MKINYDLELQFSAKSMKQARARIQTCLQDAIDDLDARLDGGIWIDKHHGGTLGGHELQAKKAGPRRR